MVAISYRQAIRLLPTAVAHDTCGGSLETIPTFSVVFRNGDYLSPGVQNGTITTFQSDYIAEPDPPSA